MGLSQWGHRPRAEAPGEQVTVQGIGVRRGRGCRTGGTRRQSQPLGVAWVVRAGRRGVPLSSLSFAGARARAARLGAKVFPAGEARHCNGVVTQGAVAMPPAGGAEAWCRPGSGLVSRLVPAGRRAGRAGYAAVPRLPSWAT